jgi:hypothetical protein
VVQHDSVHRGTGSQLRVGRPPLSCSHSYTCIPYLRIADDPLAHSGHLWTAKWWTEGDTPGGALPPLFETNVLGITNTRGSQGRRVLGKTTVPALQSEARPGRSLLPSPAVRGLFRGCSVYRLWDYKPACRAYTLVRSIFGGRRMSFFGSD